MKKVISLILVLCIVFAVVPSLAQSDMTYVYENNAAYLTKYEGTDEVVVIDSFSGGYEVKVIGKGAFSNCESVKKVVIPDTVTTIGQGAFDNCPSLEELVIPDSVTYIETKAFTNCHNLKKVVIGNGIKAVKLETFIYCGIENLVVLNPETAIFTSGYYSVYTHGRELEYWHPGSFDGCRIGTIYAPSGSKAEQYAIERKINFVSLDAASEKPFVIDEFLNELELLAIKKGFKVYKNDTSFAVQNGAEYLAISNGEIAYMKNGCLVKEKLDAYPEDAIEVFFGIVLDGKTITEFIAEDIFVLEETEDCVVIKGLKNNDERIVIPGTLKGKKVKIAEKAFANNRMLKEVTVMEGIEEVPEQCFYWTVNLEKVTLPESLVAIRERSFLGCDIKEVDIKNVTVIDTSAFAYCNKLEKVKSNSLLEKIGDEAFVGCSLLSEIDLSSVKILEGTPFLCCLSLKTVTLLSLEKWDGIKDNDADLETGRHHKKQPEGRHGGMVVYHGLSPMIKTPFRTCPSLETVTVKYPNNTTGEAFPSLFVDCPNLKSVTIENYQPNLSRWEFSNLTYDNRNGYVFVGNAKENTVIYCDDWAAEEYANLLGVKFSYLHDDMDKATSLWDDDYIMHIDNITGDKNVIIIDVTVTARNSEARKKLMDNPLWDFNIQYETENGWMHYGSLGYDILEGKATEYSQSYRLNYTISYKDNTRAYKKVMISSDKLTPFGEGCITISFDQIVDEVEIPLTRQWYEGGTLWISQVSLNAVVGVKGPTDKVMEDISGSIKFKFKDGSIKPCIEVYGKSSRSSLLIFGTDNPKMYEFKATANNNVVNLDEIESVIVNDVEYKLENYTQAE